MPSTDTKTIKSAPVFYIIGDEQNARMKECNIVVDEILGEQDRSLALESFDLSDVSDEQGREQLIDAAISSLMSPPFLTDCRVVIIRDIGAATKENIEPLVKYFANPTETSHLIMIQGGGRILPTLTKAFKPISVQRGQQSEQIPDLYARLMRENGFKFEAGVREAIFSRVANDNSKLEAIFSRLVSTFGTGSKISVEDVSPFLGEAGVGPIYELANHICNGETQQSLEIVSRLMNSTSISSAKPMHALQIVSLLANHFRKLAILDSPDIRNKNDAHLALGSKGNPWGSQKSWELSRRLGSKRLLKAMVEISNADTSLKGDTAIEGQIIVELLIITLCKLCA